MHDKVTWTDWSSIHLVFDGLPVLIVSIFEHDKRALYGPASAGTFDISSTRVPTSYQHLDRSDFWLITVRVGRLMDQSRKSIQG